MKSNPKKHDVLVVGAGFAGSVIAERLANVGLRVILIDRREHIGGNAFDELDENGILIHRYGPHIFHTNAARVVEYLSQFTEWTPYEHQVLAQVEGQLLPIPINRLTINGLYGLNLDEAGVKAYFERVREPREPILTSEDVVLNSVGRDLYEKFFRGYTCKQWGLDPSELSAGVAARIPVRSNDDCRYFTDEFQIMPKQGYNALFQRMLAHPNITLELGMEFMTDKWCHPVRHVVYTGPVDAYFNDCYGKLPYRSLRFEREHFANRTQFQPVCVVNYPNDYAFTRITEFKHMTGQTHPGTTIMREYPKSEGDPFYPVPRRENETLYHRYKTLAESKENTSFVGRLAQYRYYNMDQVVAAALKVAEKLIEKLIGS